MNVGEGKTRIMEIRLNWTRPPYNTSGEKPCLSRLYVPAPDGE